MTFQRSAPAAQSGSPHEVWYRFAGRQLGYTGNNGTNDVTTSASISDRQMVSPTAGNIGTFRNSSTYGQSYGDFAQSYDPLNSYAQGAGAGSYTVRIGDTLQSIAQSIYGDGNLWYKIAEANGLTGNASLIEGRTLTLPAGVAKNTYNDTTMRPYNPQEAIGDLSPTNAKPPKKPKCGVAGLILLAVIAVAVTALTAGAALAAATPGLTLGGGITAALGLGAAGSAAAATGGLIGTFGVAGGLAVGAGAAMAGSIVSQGVGVATGIQDKFSWKGVAIAGLGSFIGGGVGAATKFAGNGVLAVVGRAAASSAITQGVSVVTGLQDKFDWAGVAAAGVGAGVGSLIGGGLAGKGILGVNAGENSFGNFAASTAASALANAATRSAINGESFGQNLIAAIPDVIAQILQRAMGTAVDGVRTPAADPVRTERLNTEAERVAKWVTMRDQPPEVVREAADISLGFQDRALALGETGNPALAIHSDADLQSGVTTIARARADGRAAAQGRVLRGESVGPESARAAAISVARRVGGAEVAQITQTALQMAYVDDDIYVFGSNPRHGRLDADFVADINKYLGPVGAAAAWVNTQIEKHPWASFALDVLDFASGPVTAIASRVLMASPVGQFVENNIGRAVRWLNGQGLSTNAILGGVTVAGALLGASKALDFFRLGARALGRRLGGGNAPELSSFNRNYLEGSGGRWGGSAVRRQNYELAAPSAGRGANIQGGGFASEEWISGPGGGTRGGTWVDITITENGVTRRIQTVDVDRYGNPTPRELENAARIRAQFPTDQLELVPKRRN